jgi:drug/metabolite transporter (DMT)-like permease
MFILIVPILSYRLLQEKFHLNHALAILIGFVGVFFIITEGDLSRLASSSTIGIIVLLLSAVSYAFYQISTSKYTREVNSSVDSFALFYVVMVMISGYSLLASIVNSTFTLEIVSDAWLWIVMLAIFSTILAFVGYFEAAKGIPVNTLSIFLMLQMLVPFFVDIFFLGKTYSLWIYTGGFLIVLGMVFVTRIPLEKPMEVPSIS